MFVCASTVVAAVAIGTAGVSADNSHDGADADVVAHWTPERVQSAVPRDLVVDSRGLGYLRSSNGGLIPYGHSQRAQLEQVAAGTPIPQAKPPSGGNDATAPTITAGQPVGGSTITTSTVEISAAISDASGIRSVTVTVSSATTSQTFNATSLPGGRYGVTISGFTDGAWSYRISARDNAKGAGNTAEYGPVGFTVDTGGGPVDPGVVANSPWISGGDIQLSAGRILFEMPTIRGNRTTWAAYVCSGTVVTDTNTNASVILTAAHCVYDDVAKAFARNVLFIPNQDGTTGTGTDWNCVNDPIGCWTPSHGVVDVNWTTRTFPNNVEWDYAYYVVPNDGSSSYGLGPLETNVNELTIGFDTTAEGNVSHALGYSYSDDPNFMYCSELTESESAVNWWLPNCDLSGGSSGGPWVQPMGPSGSGPIVSVNSWGYTTGPGMAGPHLDTSAQCVFAQANNTAATPVNRGVVVSGCAG
jgi:hypothetical protein